MDKEIQRFCWFDTVGKAGEERDTIWKYKRAIEGHKFILVDIETAIDRSVTETNGIRIQIYDGHTYTKWGSFANIFDQSTLRLQVLNIYNLNAYSPLNNWECKEFTLSARNVDPSYTQKFGSIVYFYEIPMTKAERFEYAVKQPRYKYRYGSATTLDRYET